MTGFVTTAKGRQYQLPPLTGWELRWTSGTPCDSFTVRFAADAETASQLQPAVRFQAVENGTVYFTGVVDEYEITLGASGLSAAISGRGMAALLLDNEAGTVDYDNAQLEDILKAYVYPFGIKLGEHVDFPTLRRFGVDSGDSCYAALYGFTRWAGDVMPRFDRLGRLVLLPDGGGRRWTLKDGAVLEAVFTDKRYGVISEVVVNDRSTGTQQTVKDEKFIAEGGCCRRVMSMYSRTAYRTAARTGEQMIELSGMDRRVLELRLSGLPEAMPGDIVDVTLTKMGITGRFVVAECEAALTGQGLQHVLSLRTW